jgi:hypothetical protein
MEAGLEGDDVRRGSSAGAASEMASDNMGIAVIQTVPGKLSSDFIARHLGEQRI